MLKISFEDLNKWQKFALIRALDILLLVAVGFTTYGLVNVARYGRLTDWAEFAFSVIVLWLALEIRPTKDPVHRFWCWIKTWF